MVITHKKPEANMKRNVLQTGRCGTSILAGMAGLMLMAVSALGQLSQTYSTPIRINADTISSPYANPIVVAGATGAVEKVTVTLSGLTHGFVNAVAVLLVGPNGQAVVLMSASGGNSSANGLTLTFDNSGGTLPQNSALSSGTFAPANYAGAGLSFSGPAPTGGYAAALSALAGGTPNGTWTLYILDTFPQYIGAINSWTLNLYTSPLIYPTTGTNNTVWMDENTAATIPVTLLESSPGATLTVSAALSPANGNLINPTNIVINPVKDPSLTRTVTFHPKADQSFTNTIVLSVQDSVGGAVSTDITLAVNHIVQAPTNSIYFDAYTANPATPNFASTNLLAGNGQSGSITIAQGGISPVLTSQLADPEASPNIVIIPVSSNPNILRVAGVTFDNNTGSGLIRNFTIVPVPGAAGTATLQFFASDGVTRSWTNWAAVQVTVTSASHPVIGDSAPIGLYTSGIAYDTLTVAGVPGLIGKVTVSLLGLTNINPQGISIGLQGPNGPLIPLILANSLSVGPQDWAELTLDDNAIGGLLPPATSITNFIMEAQVKLSGTPASPGAFIGMNPNGPWTLYVTNGAVGPGSCHRQRLAAEHLCRPDHLPESDSGCLCQRRNRPYD